MAHSKVSKKLVPISEFIKLAPICASTVEDWLRRKPSALPKVIRIGTYRYFKRDEAFAWLRDHWAAEVHEIAFEQGRWEYE